MTLFFTLLSFAALCVYSIMFAQLTGCKKAFAPLGGVCFTIFYFSLAACLDVLIVGGYIYFLLAAVCLIWLLSTKKTVFWKEPLPPSVCFFLLASLGVIVLFAFRQPLFSTWDEFSLWGTAAKLVKLNGHLYTTAEIQWAWTATQKPGLILFGYFFDFFGAHAEWRIAAGYDVLLFACFATLLEPLKGKARSLAVPAAFIAFLTPFIFTIYAYPVLPATTYFSSLGDLPMGILMAGALISWFGEKHDSVKSLILPALALFALTYTRDTALPLAMITAGIMLVDIIAQAIIEKRKLLLPICKALLLMLVPVLSFLSWSVYLKLAININSFEVGGQDQLNMLSLLVNGVSELFGIGTTEKFSTIMGKMLQSLFTTRLTYFGSGIVLIIAFAAMCCVFLFCERSRARRIRYLIASVLMLLGFAAFYIFTGFCFVYVLKPVEAESLSGYIRYVYPYYIAWFMLMLFFLLKAAAANAKRAIYCARLCIFGICAVFFAVFVKIVPSHMNVIDYYDDFLLSRRQGISYSKQVQEQLPKDGGNIFFVSQGDNGVRWFTYCCDMLPLQLDYSFGGGTIAAPKSVPENELYFIPLTKTEFTDYLVKNDCDYVFVERADDLFFAEFSSLFSDKLASCLGGKSALYMIDNTNGEISLKFVKSLESL